MLLHKNSFPPKYDLLTCWVIILTEGALGRPRKDKDVIFPGITHQSFKPRALTNILLYSLRPT